MSNQRPDDWAELMGLEAGVSERDTLVALPVLFRQMGSTLPIDGLHEPTWKAAWEAAASLVEAARPMERFAETFHASTPPEPSGGEQ